MVLGVSTDSPAKHRKFRAKYDLPFTLLADVEHEVAEAYGVWGERSLFGIKYMGIARTTFVIGPDGRIRHVFEKVDPDEHAAEVISALAGA